MMRIEDKPVLPLLTAYRPVFSGAAASVSHTFAAAALPETPSLRFTATDTFQARRTPVYFGRIHKAQGPLVDLQQQGIMVLGAGGRMGAGILQNAWQHGYKVVAVDTNMAALPNAMALVQQSLEGAVKKGIIKPDDYQALLTDKPITQVDGYALREGKLTSDTLPQAGLVVEAVIENMDEKKKTLKALEPLLPEDTIIATNTSSLSVNEMATVLQHPERFIGLHYFQPAERNPLVEVIPGEKTSPETVAHVLQFARSLGKVPVLIQKDSPGFAANRLLMAVGKAGLDLLDDGFSPALIDQVGKELLWPDGVGIPDAEKKMIPPIGMFKLFGGLGVEVAENLQPLVLELADKYNHSQTFYIMPERLKTEKNRVENQPDIIAAKQHLEMVLEVFKNRYEQLEAAKKQLSQTALEEMTPENTPLLNEYNLAKQAVLEAHTKLTQAEKNHGYFTQPDTLTPGTLHHKMSEKDQKTVIRSRLLGVIQAVSRQIVAEGLCTPEDMNTLQRVAFNWNILPTTVEQDTLAKKYTQQAYGVSLERPSLDSPPEGIKTHLDEKIGIYTITIDNVRNLKGGNNFNTLGIRTLQNIKFAVQNANADDKVKAIVFRGNGGKIFVAGADLNEMMAPGITFEQQKAYVELGREVMNTIADSKKLTVAVVDGDAYGGGVELALACHKIIASKNATFTLPEVGLGIAPLWGGTERLTEKIGPYAAKALILGGAPKTGVVPQALQKEVNQILKWDIDARTGTRLTAVAAEKLGLVQDLTEKAGIDHLVNHLLTDEWESYQQKPEWNRGMQRTEFRHYQKDDAYAAILFTLNPLMAQGEGSEDFPDQDSIEERTYQLIDDKSRPGWNLAKRLIDTAALGAGTGKYTDQELKKVLKNARAKQARVDDLIAIGKSYQKGEKWTTKRKAALLLYPHWPMVKATVVGWFTPKRHMTGTSQKESA